MAEGGKYKLLETCRRAKKKKPRQHGCRGFVCRSTGGNPAGAGFKPI